MYLRTEHHLEHPICQCFYRGDFESYSWSIYQETTEKVGLIILCDMCGVELKIPNEHFRARVAVHNFDEEKKNYNKAKKNQEHKEEKKFIPKVLEFPNREEENSE